MAQRVGIFGGSFDPPHLGHEQLALSFLNSGHIDLLWILPVPEPPHKNKSRLTPFVHRLAMAKRQFSDLSKCKVSDFEAQLDPPHATWKTLQKLSKTYPEHEFTLCIGGDSLASFTKWIRYESILEGYPLLVAERPGFDLPELPGKITSVPHQKTEVSATEIRRKIKEDLSGWEKDVAHKVRSYILEKGLYR